MKLIFTLLLAACLSSQADIYVSVSGNDANAGTQSSPVRTITHGYALASSGSRVVVLPGTYTDYQSGWGLHLNKSGITVIAQSVATIDGQNASDRNQAIYLDGSGNTVNGFIVTGGPNGGIAIYGSQNTVTRCEIRNNGNVASTSTNGKDGIYSDQSTSGGVYLANYIHNNGRSGQNSNLDHGLYLTGQNEHAFNNVCLLNSGCGLQIAGYQTINGLKVYNNVMAYNGTEGIIIWMSMGSVDIKNNVLYHNGLYGLTSYAGTGGGVACDHNCSSANGSGDLNFTAGGSTYSFTQSANLLTDPQLVNEASSAFDAHLKSGSPLASAGVNLSSLFTTDKDGNLRPASGVWSIGAYSATATNIITMPQPPINLHVVLN